MTEFPKTASQNADHVPLSNPSLLIHSPYPGPSLRFPFIDMAMRGPVVERPCPKWTADPSDWVICKCIVFFCLLIAGFLSSLYLPIGFYVINQLDPIEELYDMYSEEEDTPRIVELGDDGLDLVLDIEEPANPYIDL